MGDLAHRALSLVFAEHAGCLGSFRSDARARLFRAYEIVRETEDAVQIVYERRGPLKFVESLRYSTVNRIHRLSPGLLPRPDRGRNPTALCVLTIHHIYKLHDSWLNRELREADRSLVAKKRRLR
jgi:hypothetical protein